MQRATLVPLLLGFLLLAALVSAISQFGELERFLELMRHVKPFWLLSSLSLQAGTYLCEAMAWRLALRLYGYDLPLPALVPLSLAKLFSDQAMPSGGISGNAFFVVALRRRGIARELARSCMLVDLAAYFSSYASMTAMSLLVLAVHDELSRWLLALTSAFIAIQMSVPLLLWHVGRHGLAHANALRLRYPRLQAWTATLQTSATLIPRHAGLFIRLTALHAAIMLLDAGSLWTMLLGIGQHLPFELAFSSFVTASMVMSLSPIPLGLGTFETTCVAMLRAAGIGLEAGLTATILLRGLTTWLPMLPGIWLVKREMRETGRPAA